YSSTGDSSPSESPAAAAARSTTSRGVLLSTPRYAIFSPMALLQSALERHALDLTGGIERDANQVAAEEVRIVEPRVCTVRPDGERFESHLGREFGAGHRVVVAAPSVVPTFVELLPDRVARRRERMFES